MNNRLRLSDYTKISIFIIRKSIGKVRYHTLLAARELISETKTLLVKQNILATKPVNAYRNSQIQVCSVTSHENFFMLLLAYKSFIYCTDLKCDYLVFDDGSMTDFDKKVIRSHIRNVTIINKQEYDTKVKQYFGIKSPVWLYRDSPYIIKKIGTFLFASKPKIIFMDSDIIFFKPARELQLWAMGKYDWFYIRDCLANSYVLSDIEAREIFHRQLTPYVNSGLIGLLKKDMDINMLIKLIDIHSSLSFGRPPQMQVYFSLLISKIKNHRKILPLPRTYLVTEDKNQFKAELVCGHYTRLVRERYFTDAWRALSFLK